MIAPFSGLVAPAAHNFVINFMSNHSAANPGGQLTREVLKSFFSVSGNPGSFIHTPGHERIPSKWYKRPVTNLYTIANVFEDLLINNAMYPGIIQFGGNIGTVNSFVGVEIGAFTNNVYNLTNLAQGNNAVCFFIQAASTSLAASTDPIVALGMSLYSWFISRLGPISTKFNCPQLQKIDGSSIFKQYPGAAYTAQGQSISFLSSLTRSLTGLLTRILGI